MSALHDIVTKDSTDRSVVLRIFDSADGTPETAVEHNTAGIDLWYRREGAAKTSITEAALAALTTAHTDGGIEHISDGNYRLDLPDAAFATGANYVDFGGTVTDMIVIGGRVRLVDVDMEDAVRAGLTALPNAAADAAGGLVISDAGGLDIDSKLSTATSALATSAALATVDTIVDAIKVTTDQFVFTVANQVDANALSGGGGLDAAGVRSALGMATANLDTQIGDIPTVSEFNARTLVAADYFDPATDTVAHVTLVDTTTTNTDMRGTDSALLASTNGSGLTAIPDMATVTNQTAIKAVTDQFVFTVANQVDSNALSGGGGLDAAGVRSAIGLASANLDTQLGDIPTVSEFNARTLVAADYFDPATDTVANVTTVATTTTNTDMVTAAAIRSEIDSNSTQLAAIVADTNELQADWVDGGRLDLILDARSSQASVDSLISDLLTTQMTESYAADGVAPTLAQALMLIQQRLYDFAISGTALTVKKLDGSTTAATITLDSATAPTSSARTA